MPKENKNAYSETRLTFVMVLHASLSDMQKVDEFLDSLEDLRVVYKKCSSGKLYITEELAEAIE